MHRIHHLLLLLMFALLPGLSFAEQSLEEAQALVKRAAAYLQTQGKQKALAEFNRPKNQFIDRELYVFVLDAEGNTLANGVTPKIVGKNVREMKDLDGKAFIREILQIGNEKGSGWVDYKWPDPVSGRLRDKRTFVEKSGDLYICAGIYK